MRKIARVGTRNMYLGPDGRTALRYPEAKAAFARLASLQSELDSEVEYGKATGLGDHAKIDRLVNAIHAATGKQPWELPRTAECAKPLSEVA